MKNRLSIIVIMILLAPFVLFGQENDDRIPLNNSEVVDTTSERMPMFPGCDGLGQAEMKACAQRLMLEYIYTNVTYPVAAREAGVEGTIVIRFTVENDGSLSNIKCVRDIGAGCGQEGVRVVESMPTWIPGMQRGKPVLVEFNLPIKFKLDKKTRRKAKKNRKG